MDLWHKGDETERKAIYMTVVRHILNLGLDNLAYDLRLDGRTIL